MLSSQSLSPTYISEIENKMKEANSRLTALQRHAKLTEEYIQLNEKFERIQIQLLHAKIASDAEYQLINTTLDALIVEIRDVLAPYQVSVTNKIYDQTINRICFRGDDRSPIADNAEGVFDLGFTKKKMSAEYQKWVERFYYSENVTSDLRVTRPLAINRAETNPTSRDPKTAAFFPIPFKLTRLKQNDVLTSLQSKLNALDIPINVNESYVNEVSKIGDPTLLLELQNTYYSESQKKILVVILEKHLGEKCKDIEKILLKNESDLFSNLQYKDTSWIYIVFVGKGFDVSSHGYTHASWNKSCINQHHAFFSQEICTDEIIPEHVIAAVQIERDFTQMHLDRDSMQQSGRFHGGANFVVLKMIYNEKALNHFSQYDIDVDCYKKLLDSYFSEKMEHNINLSDDGYVRNESYTPTANRF